MDSPQSFWNHIRKFVIFGAFWLLIAGAFIGFAMWDIESHWSSYPVDFSAILGTPAPGASSASMSTDLTIAYVRTRWDWMELLAVPAILALTVAGMGVWNAYQNRKNNNDQRQLDRLSSKEEKQLDRELMSEENEQDRVQARLLHEHRMEIENDRVEEQALNDYIEVVSRLLLDYKLGELTSHDEKVVASARTLSTLSRINPERKAALLLFLYGAQLILSDNPNISLVSADLNGIVLFNSSLPRINLSGATLSNVVLSHAKLRDSVLSHVDFDNANLIEADLLEADLGNCDIKDSNFLNTHLEYANLASSKISNTVLNHAKLMDSVLTWVMFVDAKLVKTNLRRADLSGAWLANADLSQSILANEFGHDQIEVSSYTMYNNATLWPEDFEPPPGATNIDELSSSERGEFISDWWRTRDRMTKVNS